MQFDQNTIARVRTELERRRSLLVAVARNSNAPIDQLDREEILLYLGEGKLPVRPDSVPDLLRAFFSSCFTYAVLRKFCVAKFGRIPMRSTIGDRLRSQSVTLGQYSCATF